MEEGLSQHCIFQIQKLQTSRSQTIETTPNGCGLPTHPLYQMATLTGSALPIHPLFSSNGGVQNNGDCTLTSDEWGKPPSGLSSLVERYLGKPLDKSNQLSDWEKRPLRIDQIRYAGECVFC